MKGEGIVKANKEIRDIVETNRIKFCEIADQIGIADTTLCRWMRVEMKPDQRAKVEKAIKEITEKLYS